MSPCIDHGLKGNKPQGYHQVRVKGKLVYVHRLALADYLSKPVSELALVRHLCNNPRCVNPVHLKEGTHQDNANDRVASGRSAKIQMARRCLTPEESEQVVALYSLRTKYHDEISHASLALRFNTSKRIIGLVIKRGAL